MCSSDLKEIVILEKKINIIDSDITQDFKEANLLFYSPNKIKINVETDAPSFLVLSDVWYPGWKAYDNGKESEIYKTNYIVRSIYIDKGEHNIEFVYDSSYFKVGKIITLITIMFIVLFFLYFFAKRQKTTNSLNF